MPRHAVVVLLDSLNRHHVGAYGGTEFDTPHLDRFARRALRFTNHHAGSLPCMPARHDVLCTTPRSPAGGTSAVTRTTRGARWRTRRPSARRACPRPARRRSTANYDTSRSWLRTEDDFPGPRTMQAAARWLRDTAGRHDRSLLFVDEFDPHEPFDTPEPWASR